MGAGGPAAGIRVGARYGGGMIQPPARFGEGESAGRRPGGSAAEVGFARLPALWAGGLRPALPLQQSLLCHTAVEPQGRGQPVAFTGSPISEEKVVPFPAKRRLTVVFRIYSITLGLKPVV